MREPSQLHPDGVAERVRRGRGSRRSLTSALQVSHALSHDPPPRCTTESFGLGNEALRFFSHHNRVLRPRKDRYLATSLRYGLGKAHNFKDRGISYYSNLELRTSTLEGTMCSWETASTMPMHTSSEHLLFPSDYCTTRGILTL